MSNIALVAVVPFVLLAAPDARAQVAATPAPPAPAAPRPEGFRADAIWGELGAINLQKGGWGFLSGLHAGLGTAFAPWMDLTGGLRYWTADIDRSEFGDTAEGKVRTLSLHPDLRAHLLDGKGVRPYVLVGLSAAFVSADVPNDASLEDALGGFRVGLDTGVGLASTNRGARWRVEVRRELMEDVGNWSFTAGLGTWPASRARRGERPASSAPSPKVEQFAPVLEDEQGESPRSSRAGERPAPSDERLTELEERIRDLTDENRAMRTEVSTLRQALEEERQRASASSPASSAGGTSWTIGATLAFIEGSADLTDAGRAEVQRVAQDLARAFAPRILVEGHTDAAGDALRNLTLSEERANAVKDELVRAGIDAARIRTIGLGSTEPVAGDGTEDGRRRNQRVEIRIVER